MLMFSIYKNELRNTFMWHLGWLLTLIFLLLLVILIYPGDQAMKDFMPLLQIDLFEAFIGSIGGSSPNYTLWIAILLPMIVVFYFIYGITTGVRVVTQSLSDHTGELIHTLPVSRNKFLITRILVTFGPFILFFILQFLLLWSNFFGYGIEFNKLVTITWWGILFLVGSMCIGMILGLLASNSGRGLQFSFIFVLFLYAIQILGRLQPDYANINNFNPLNFYQPEVVLLTNTMKEGEILGQNFPLYPIYTILLVFFLIIFSFVEFNRKDLSEDAGIHLNGLKKIKTKNRVILIFISGWRRFKELIIPGKIRNNPFVFWARFFEKKFPVTADFVYSDNMTLFIAFLALVSIFPFQLGLYPGDTLIKQSIVGFGSNPFFLFITYGSDLTATPYLWFVISQALGVVWIVMLPIIFYWSRKAMLKDGNTELGEIFGGIPINPRTIVYQRIFAIFLELVYLILWMIVFVIFSEFVTGSSYDQLWEIIALLCSIPFYMFLLVIMCELSLLFKNRGSIVSVLFLSFIVLSFFISVVNKVFDVWYIRGIFSLYNPVLILQEKSLTVANNGMLFLTLGTFVLLIFLLKLTDRYQWLNIVTKSSKQ